MLDWLLLLQLALSVGLAGVIAERAVYLLLVAPASPRALRWLSQSVGEGRTDRALFWARQRSNTHVARILLTALEPVSERSPAPDDADDLGELILQLTERAVLRLRLIRVGATVSSTTGLLIGIVRISGGYAAPSGLLALEAGLTERMALSSALFSMAVGVGTSAVCFYATSQFRKAARQLITQSARAAQLVRIPA